MPHVTPNAVRDFFGKINPVLLADWLFRQSNVRVLIEGKLAHFTANDALTPSQLMVAGLVVGMEEFDDVIMIQDWPHNFDLDAWVGDMLVHGMPFIDEAEASFMGLFAFDGQENKKRVHTWEFFNIPDFFLNGIKDVVVEGSIHLNGVTQEALKEAAIEQQIHFFFSTQEHCIHVYLPVEVLNEMPPSLEVLAARNALLERLVYFVQHHPSPGDIQHLDLAVLGLDHEEFSGYWNKIMNAFGAATKSVTAV
jgi:hypothetical protein